MPIFFKIFDVLETLPFEIYTLWNLYHSVNHYHLFNKCCHLGFQSLPRKALDSDTLQSFTKYLRQTLVYM